MGHRLSICRDKCKGKKCYPKSAAKRAIVRNPPGAGTPRARGGPVPEWVPPSLRPASCYDAFVMLPATIAVPIGLIGDVGGGEVLVILAAILMLFGGKRLPSIARSLGKTSEELRRAAESFREQLLNADRDPDPQRPPPAPAQLAGGSIPPAALPEDEPQGPTAAASAEPAGPGEGRPPKKESPA